MDSSSERIKGILSSLPGNPGVYLMKGADGHIIYIGKATSLKKRVSSYFNRTDLDPKTRVLVNAVDDIEFIVTDSEMEALLLESALIKKHKPRYNIRLKDDKHYPYIAVTLDDEYPRIIYTRRIRGKKNRYFGPYADSRAARNTVEMLNRVFRLRTCRRDLPLKEGERPCLNRQMNRCLGPCTGSPTLEEYRMIVDDAIHFLEGNVDPVIDDLQKQMNIHAQAMRYEAAAAIRDILLDIRKIASDQKVASPLGTDCDYVGTGSSGDDTIVILFEFRQGVLLGRKIRVYGNTSSAAEADILRSFILDYYSMSPAPQRIVLPVRIAEEEVLARYLTERCARQVRITTAESREDRGVMLMLGKNLEIILDERRNRDNADRRARGLDDLATVLGLPSPPAHMECFDISNFQGTDSVASMVLFSNGLPDKSGYRRYRIRGYTGANDPAMIHEVVARRLQHLLNENEDLPDLMVIDGGPTQLTRAMEAAAVLDAPVKIVSLAKRLEEIYTDPGMPPVNLPEHSPALQIMQNIRDEAHRFAITYHRKLREKRTLRSELEDIPGIGPETRKALLARFGSVEGVRSTTVEELTGMPGIGEKTALAIYNFFHGTDKAE